jgi:integrase/recombinase XerC
MQEEQFYNYLNVKQLGERTIYKYLRCFHNFQRYDLTQDGINKFLRKYKAPYNRAFLRTLLEAENRADLIIPKITGRKKDQIKTILDPDEAQKLCDGLYNTDMAYGIVFDLSYSCGLRLAEVMGIKARDIDWVLWRDRRHKPSRLKILGKGNRERWVIVSAGLMQILAEYCKDLQLDDKLFNFSERTWHRKLGEAGKIILNKKVSPHDLRRTRGTQWYREGKDIIQIKNRLGHSFITTTQLYIVPESQKQLEKWEEELID